MHHGLQVVPPATVDQAITRLLQTDAKVAKLQAEQARILQAVDEWYAAQWAEARRSVAEHIAAKRVAFERGMAELAALEEQFSPQWAAREYAKARAKYEQQPRITFLNRLRRFLSPSDRRALRAARRMRQSQDYKAEQLDRAYSQEKRRIQRSYGDVINQDPRSLEGELLEKARAQLLKERAQRLQAEEQQLFSLRVSGVRMVTSRTLILVRRRLCPLYPFCRHPE
jgi:hypothetical protein